jgi:hypothetical protein
MKKLICGKENIESFRGELKAATPVFYSLAKELYTSGMISGLRGATLEFMPFTEPALVDDQQERQEQRTCEDCGQWQRDNVGDGAGIGLCLLNINPKQVKWPGIAACHKIEAIA